MNFQNEARILEIFVKHQKFAQVPWKTVERILGSREIYENRIYLFPQPMHGTLCRPLWRERPSVWITLICSNDSCSYINYATHVQKSKNYYNAFPP